jgi:hypothetical protein
VGGDQEALDAPQQLGLVGTSSGMPKAAATMRSMSSASSWVVTSLAAMNLVESRFENSADQRRLAGPDVAL